MRDRIFRTLIIFCLVLGIRTVPARALDPPVLATYVTDMAGVLSASEREALEQRLAQFEQSTSSQFVVLIIPSLEGLSIEQYALSVVEKNRVGQSGKDNGLLLLIAVQDKKLRFEVGYGLEGVLTDAATSMIISDVITPEFRSGNFAAGIDAGMEAAMSVAKGEFTAPPKKKSGGSKTNFSGLIIFLIILFIVLRAGRKGRGGGIWFIPGGFGGGGFGSSGGFSGGGSDFGGFSGGGGSFGGGGSSGSW